MLGKSKTIIDETIPYTPPATIEEKTIIGEHITIEGNIQGNEDLIIEGSVTGSIELDGHHLLIGQKGKVDAKIQAENVTISGQLTGNIKALGTVKINKDANFNGEIKAKHLSVEDGAYLNAAIELEPKKEAVPITKSVNKENSVKEQVLSASSKESEKRL